jgi:N-acetylmuramoyl-L-alanine amidase
LFVLRIVHHGVLLFFIHWKIKIHYSYGARAKKVLCRTILGANASRSRNLAKALQEEMVNATGNTDRGIKNTQDLRVLRMQLCPAALVEIGFLTNPRTERRLRTPSYREKIAAAIAKGIDSFVRNDG